MHTITSLQFANIFFHSTTQKLNGFNNPPSGIVVTSWFWLMGGMLSRAAKNNKRDKRVLRETRAHNNNIQRAHTQQTGVCATDYDDDGGDDDDGHDRCRLFRRRARVCALCTPLISSEPRAPVHLHFRGSAVYANLCICVCVGKIVIIDSVWIN